MLPLPSYIFHIGKISTLFDHLVTNGWQRLMHPLGVGAAHSWKVFMKVFSRHESCVSYSFVARFHDWGFDANQTPSSSCRAMYSKEEGLVVKKLFVFIIVVVAFGVFLVQHSDVYAAEAGIGHYAPGALADIGDMAPPPGVFAFTSWYNNYNGSAGGE
jgi:hypothetical protein